MCAFASLAYTSTGSKSTTFSTTDAGCPMYGAIALFKEAGGAGGPTPIPPGLHGLDRQHSTIIAHRLGGCLQ
jgi:hypothetical protein